MIRVDREQRDEAGNSIRPNDDWFRLAANETAKAITEKANHEPVRAIYSHAQVKQALDRLFHGKCAYCEFRTTGGSDWDVEHFRPKARPAERADHPGYYWLTYDWNNLYLSCKHCNQRRIDRPRWGESIKLPAAAGKANQFPLADESTRAMDPSYDVKAEKRLLIDPCFDDPGDYLGYNPVGEVFSLGDHPQGIATIDVLHLQRKGLKDRRREKADLVTTLIKVKRMCSHHPGAVRKVDELFEKELSSESEYAGLARYIASRPSEFGA